MQWLADPTTPEGTRVGFRFLSYSGTDTSGVPFAIIPQDTAVRIMPPNRPPGAVVLEFPSNGVYLDSSLFSLRFTVPSDSDRDALHMVMEISGTSDFSGEVLVFDSRDHPSGFSPEPPVPEGSGTMRYTLQNPLPDGRWYWRVRAWDGKAYGPYSEVWRFVVDTQPPVIDSLVFTDALYQGRWYNPHQDTTATARLRYTEAHPAQATLFGDFLSDTLKVPSPPAGSNQTLDFKLPSPG